MATVEPSPGTPNVAGPSLLGRALLAVSLLVGFYVLALGIAGGLTGLIVFSLSEGRAGAWMLGAGAAVLAILRGIFFVEHGDDQPVGLRVTVSDQPRLIEVIRSIADRMEQKFPDQIYLVPDVNAFVYQESHFLGLRPGKRVMGIGLGLLNVLRVDQLRAVLAHEFGHFAGGDTRLGGVIYRARASIARTIGHLTSGVLRRLFVAYGNLFMRLTQRVSRRQELSADVAAARIGGKRAQIDALKKIHATAPLFELLLDAYVAPAWSMKYSPPNLYEGFRALLGDATRQKQMHEQEQTREHEDPYDSHPPISKRIEYIESLTEDAPEDPRDARELLENSGATEESLTSHIAQRATGGTSRTIPWEEMGQRVFAKVFADDADRLGKALQIPRTPARLQLMLDRLQQGSTLAVAQRLIDLNMYPSEIRPTIARSVVGHHLRSAIATELVEKMGCRLALAWSGPADVVGEDGERLEIDTWIEEALKSREGVRHLGDRLRERGLLASP